MLGRNLPTVILVDAYLKAEEKAAPTSHSMKATSVVEGVILSASKSTHVALNSIPS